MKRGREGGKEERVVEAGREAREWLKREERRKGGDAGGGGKRGGKEETVVEAGREEERRKGAESG